MWYAAQHHQWHQCIPCIKMIKMRCNMTFLVIWHNHLVYKETSHYCTYKSKTFIYYAITMYVSTRNMSLKCHWYTAYANCFRYSYEITISVHIPHMDSVQSIMWPVATVYIHFTLLAYATESICQLHCTYMPQCISTLVYI